MDALISETANPAAKIKIPGERSLLIVEDDQSFSQRLAKALEQRGFIVTTADSVAEGLLQVEKAAPAYAVVDMRLDDGNGLDVISALKNRRPDARAIILTGYGNIATAVNAVKLGAVDYLAKPADADDVVTALLALDNTKIEPPENPMSADRVRWASVPGEQLRPEPRLSPVANRPEPARRSRHVFGRDRIWMGSTSGRL